MSTSLVEFIQKKMGYPPLHKVDPVDHEVKGDAGLTTREKLAQSAISAVLASLYKFARTERGSRLILASDSQVSWLDIILEDKEKWAVDKVAHYSGVSEKEAEENMRLIAVEAIQAIRESVAQHRTHEAVRKYMSDQRHSILVYLPAAMQLGSLLEDDSLDDRTNKMEGPVSNFMHTLESKFSTGGVTDKKRF
jgi:hypothetical protein